MYLAGNEVSKELTLSRGPSSVGKRYQGFIINDFQFHVKKFENRRVVVTAQTNSYASRSDNNPIIGAVTYYGILKDIIELEYSGSKSVVVFYRDWVSTERAVKQDGNGFS